MPYIVDVKQEMYLVDKGSDQPKNVMGWKVIFMGNNNWKMKCENGGKDTASFYLNSIGENIQKIITADGYSVIVKSKEQEEDTIPDHFHEVSYKKMYILFYMSVIKDLRDMYDFNNFLGDTDFTGVPTQQAEISWRDSYKMNISIT